MAQEPSTESCYLGERGSKTVRQASSGLTWSYRLFSAVTDLQGLVRDLKVRELVTGLMVMASLP